MKKYSIAILVAALMALTAGTVSADISYVDYQVLNRTVDRNETETYQHNLSNAVPAINVSDPLIVLNDDVKLELNFSDTSYEKWTWIIWPVWGVYTTMDNLAQIGADGVSLYSGTAAGADEYEFDINVLLLADGLLNVSVKNTTTRDGGAGDSFYWVSSTLSGSYQVVPVPGAVLLGMLGLSVAGARLRKNR